MVNKTLSSAFDKPISTPAYQEEKPQASTFSIPGRETKASHQAFLASNDLITGKSSLAHYEAVKEAPVVVDLNIYDLPEHMDAKELKRMSGARHVISSTVDEDRLKGICLGTGRI